MDQLKVSLLFKTLIFVSLIVTLAGSTTQNFSSKACMFFSVAVTLMFTFELEFIYERCEKIKFRVERKIKEALLWTIVGEVSFMIWLSNFYYLSELDIGDEYKGAIIFVIWIFIYHLIKCSVGSLVDLSNVMINYSYSFPHYESIKSH